MVTKHPDILARQPNYDEWFATAPHVGEWARKFYRDYVGIDDDEELKAHLTEIRTLAWEVEKYRCIASFYFVNYSLAELYGEWYSGVLDRIKGGEIVLDLGCAFGQASRALVYDGAPQENVISGDLRQEFWDLGYQLFRDKEKFHGRFFQGDIFDENYLKNFNGTISFVHISSVFHLFDVPLQKSLFRRLCQITSIRPGTSIFGRQVGNTIPEFLTRPQRRSRGLYMHSEESFKAMIEDCEPGKWLVKTWMVPRKEHAVSENGGVRGRLFFILTRLKE
jgi:SAM-dependent methyltransferase